MDANAHLITREISIDAAHRVPFHGSKCRSLHGHRYIIQATCRGPLQTSGEQTGMVLDFGFLKDEMMKAIDEPADHALMLWDKDPWLEGIEAVAEGSKILVLPCIPTAENLARYWFGQLLYPVRVRSEGIASLAGIRVYETPNCWSDYPGRTIT